MTAAARPVPSTPSSPKACDATCRASLGALAGYMFTIIHPVGGAVFGASLAVTQWGFDYALNHLAWKKTDIESSATTIARWAIPLFAGIAASAIITTAVGFPITFTAALILSAAMIATSCLITTLFGGCVIGTCVAGAVGGALAVGVANAAAISPQSANTRT